MPDLLTAFGLVAVVLTVAAVTSGLVARAPVSSPMIFLALGFLLGEHGLGVLRIEPHSEALEAVAVLSLSFVLFLDAINLRFDEMGKDWIVPVLALGPGTLLTVLIVAGAGALILSLPPVQAVLLGAVLASVDPVVLRDVVQDKRIPRSVRRALQTEAGTNDIVVLPIILVGAAIALGQTGGATDWALLLARLFLLGPLVGIAIAAAYVWLMRLARTHTTITSEYRAIGGVGTLLASYVAGEAAGSSGFLAVFAGGAAVVALDYDVCDCFLDFGAIVSELVMLLAFILFGALLSSVIGMAPLLPTLLFAGVVLVLARPVAISLVLWRAPISGRGRRFIGWFGPRGLSSLLFGLLLITYSVPGAEQLLALAGVVVIVSVVAHGVSAAPLAQRYAHAVAQATLAEEREGTASGLFRKTVGAVPRITPEELASRLASDDPPLVLDVRSRSAYAHDSARIPGDVRVAPDEVPDWAAEQTRERPVVAYCT